MRWELPAAELSSAEAAPGASGGGSPLNPWKSTEVERGPEEGHLLTLPGPLQYKVLSSPTLNRGLGHYSDTLSKWVWIWGSPAAGSLQ